MIKSPRITPEIIPPAAPILMEWFPIADGPFADIIGINPTTKASDVIIIGRNRSFAASIAEANSDFPARRRWSANSMIKIAFFASNPMSMTSAT